MTNLRSLPRRVAFPLLLVILLGGFTLRVWNLNFDRGIGSHPDERSTACFYAVTIALPTSWDQFWDPQRSPMNPMWDLQQQRPRSFTYGHLPLYAGVLMGEAFHRLAPAAEAIGLPTETVSLMQRADASCDAIAVAGRLVIALFDTLIIFLLYLLGARMIGRGGGLLAAAFYAFAAQAIQLSHFFAMDPASTAFTVLAVLGGVSMVTTRRLSIALLTGVASGLAIASKFSALPVLAAPAVAALLMVWRGVQESHQAGRALDGRVPFFAIISVAVAWLAAFAAFFITSPYAILDWETFSRAVLVEQGMMVRGVADFPFTRQYRNTLPYIYFIQQQVQWGLGWPLGIVALAGTGYAVWEALRSAFRLVSTWIALGRRSGALRWLDDAQLANLVVWAWVLPYFLITGAFLAKFNRYMSPVLPFVLLWAAWLVVVLWRAGSRDWEIRRSEIEDVETEGSGDGANPSSPISNFSISKTLSVTLAAVGLIGGLFWSLAYVNGVYNREHTWITASRWIYENAPPGSVLLWEVWDDPLPKSIPNEPGMDMGAHGLTNIDWSPYEEDTADKYELLKQKLREADYVVYSSKRIYDSVDELPERYPMTNLYYDAMWDGRLGFELAQEVTSPPQLLGFVFDDRHADESFSLYDHPQVSIFRKVRDLSDAEFDALFDRSWERAVPYFRGNDSPLSPLLEALGLGSQPGSEQSGLINRVIGLLGVGQSASAVPPPGERASLMFDTPIQELPIVDNYRWNTLASESTVLAVVWWWVVLTLLGWVTWPLLFGLFRPLRDAGFFLSRTFGWLLGGWLLWMLTSLGLLQNTVRFSWLSVLLVAAVGAYFAYRQRAAMRDFVRSSWKLLLVGEAVFGIAFLLFIAVRLQNPDIWQPWFGGEKQMEFAFLNGILRSPTFPPVNPHFAGGVINYYYFGLYLVAYLVKLTGIYAEVAFNLAIAMLFALTVVNVFAVAYSAVARKRDRGMQRLEIGAVAEDAESPAPPITNLQSSNLQSPNRQSRISWKTGLGAALLAPLYVTILGNLDGAAQIVRNLARLTPSQWQSALPGVQEMAGAAAGLQQVVSGAAQMPPYDFWGPSRVIEPTINEFPFWSFLFADLHPHIIGIPISAMFLALALVLVMDAGTDWRRAWRQGLAMVALFALLLGALASVNLWELPTYFGLGVLTFLVSQFRGRGRIDWLITIPVAVLYAGGAYLLFMPFFNNYVNVGASGVGLVNQSDPLGKWLLVWGFFLFVLVSWTFYLAWKRVGTGEGELSEKGKMEDSPAQNDAQSPDLPISDLISPDLPKPSPNLPKPSGVERAVSLFLRRYDDSPRALYLHNKLVRVPGFFYLLFLALIPATLVLAFVAGLAGWPVLALCLAWLGLAVAMLWRSARTTDAGAALTAVLTATGLAILAGTQVVYLKDFLSGSDYYRMNTLFKFFSQVWVIWGVAAAIATPRLLDALFPERKSELERNPSLTQSPISKFQSLFLRTVWAASFIVLLLASLAYPIFGTPARLDQRMMGWRPEIGTLNGLDFMREGSYAWPDFNNVIELRYEWEALQWLLSNVRGNAVILESSEVEYYRAWGTRMASNTGLSGLKGMHEQEQRYPEDVGYRDGLHRELWQTPDTVRTQQIMDELSIDLVYVGQLERFLHPDGVQKFEAMAAQGLLTPLYQNDRVTIYTPPGRLEQQPDGAFAPSDGE
jgi:YYY domain-containing protein